MNCQYLVGGNGAGASASTKIEMNKTICTLAGDGLAPAYDSVPPDAHICQVEERRELQWKTPAQAVNTNNKGLSLYIFF